MKTSWLLSVVAPLAVILLWTSNLHSLDCSTGRSPCGTPIAVDAYDGGVLGAGKDGVPALTFVGPAWCSRDVNIGPGVEDLAYRHYHKFDLAGVTDYVSHAWFEIEFPEGAYLSDEVSETFLLHDVTSFEGDFGFDFDSGITRPFSADVFRDLADGEFYGCRAYTEGDEGTVTRVELTAEAVADINAARGGKFCMGGSLSLAGTGSICCTEVAADVIFANLASPETDVRFGLPGIRRLLLETRCRPVEYLMRGDANGDGLVDLSDSISLLDQLFLGGSASRCPDAADANDDGEIDISDPTYILLVLFLGGAALPPPGPECGEDPTEDTLGECESPVCLEAQPPHLEPQSRLNSTAMR